MSDTTLRVLVREKRAEAEDICVFEPAPCDGAPLPPFEPGAHIDIHVRDSLVRQYSSGATFEVGAGQTVVEVLQQNGIKVPVSCEQAVCGTCLTRVLEGELDHRDVFLTDAEKAANDQFTPCCSRAKSSRLVLDL